MQYSHGQKLPSRAHTPLEVMYTNSMGVESLVEIEVLNLRYGTNKSYPEPGWLVIGRYLKGVPEHLKTKVREFAVKNMKPIIRDVDSAAGGAENKA